MLRDVIYISPAFKALLLRHSAHPAVKDLAPVCVGDCWCWYDRQSFPLSTCLQQCTSLSWRPCLQWHFVQVRPHFTHLYPLGLTPWPIWPFAFWVLMKLREDAKLCKQKTSWSDANVQLLCAIHLVQVRAIIQQNIVSSNIFNPKCLHQSLRPEFQNKLYVDYWSTLPLCADSYIRYWWNVVFLQAVQYNTNKGKHCYLK